MSLWSGMFFDGLSIKLNKQGLTGAAYQALTTFDEQEELELETREVVFTELTLAVHLMVSFQIPHSSITGFLAEIQSVMRLEPARISMLHQLLNYESPAKGQTAIQLAHWLTGSLSHSHSYSHTLTLTRHWLTGALSFSLSFSLAHSR